MIQRRQRLTTLASASGHRHGVAVHTSYSSPYYYDESGTIVYRSPLNCHARIQLYVHTVCREPRQDVKQPRSISRRPWLTRGLFIRGRIGQLCTHTRDIEMRRRRIRAMHSSSRTHARARTHTRPSQCHMQHPSAMHGITTRQQQSGGPAFIGCHEAARRLGNQLRALPSYGVVTGRTRSMRSRGM